jgi:hypothetical protein
LLFRSHKWEDRKYGGQTEKETKQTPNNAQQNTTQNKKDFETLISRKSAGKVL